MPIRQLREARCGGHAPARHIDRPTGTVEHPRAVTRRNIPPKLSRDLVDLVELKPQDSLGHEPQVKGHRVGPLDVTSAVDILAPRPKTLVESARCDLDLHSRMGHSPPPTRVIVSCQGDAEDASGLPRLRSIPAVVGRGR